MFGMETMLQNTQLLRIKDGEPIKSIKSGAKIGKKVLASNNLDQCVAFESSLAPKRYPYNIKKNVQSLVCCFCTGCHFEDHAPKDFSISIKTDFKQYYGFEQNLLKLLDLDPNFPKFGFFRKYKGKNFEAPKREILVKYLKST